MKSLGKLGLIVWIFSILSFIFLQLIKPATNTQDYDNAIGFFVYIGIISFIVMILGAFAKTNMTKNGEHMSAINKESKRKLVRQQRWNPWIIVTIVLVAIVIFLAGRITYTKPLSRDECYRLGSNERTKLCLQEVDRRNPGPTPIRLNGDMFTLKLATANGDYFPLTITNNSGHNVKNLVIKFLFYKESPKQNPNCGSVPPIDTQYWTLQEFMGAGDVRSVSAYVPTAMTWGSFCVLPLGAEAM